MRVCTYKRIFPYYIGICAGVAQTTTTAKSGELLTQTLCRYCLNSIQVMTVCDLACRSIPDEKLKILPLFCFWKLALVWAYACRHSPTGPITTTLVRVRCDSCKHCKSPRGQQYLCFLHFLLLYVYGISVIKKTDVKNVITCTHATD